MHSTTSLRSGTALSSSGKIEQVHVGVHQTNLDYLSARLFYCTDEMPPDVVELLGPFDINIDEQYAIYGYTYAAAAHAFSKILFLGQRGTINDLGKPHTPTIGRAYMRAMA